MWKQHSKIYPTSNPNLIITAICGFPNLEDTLEIVNEVYKIDDLNTDKKFREIYSYYYLLHGGRHFIPIAFSDRIPKLEKLQALKPMGKGWFWCIGYVSTCLEGGANSLNAFSRKLNTPLFNECLEYLEYHTKHYESSTTNSINSCLAKDCLRKYVYENAPEKLDAGRRFQLLYNNSTIFDLNHDWTMKDWLDHLHNLKNRDIYEILVNDFK